MSKRTVHKCDFCPHEFGIDEPHGQLALTHITSTGHEDANTLKDICCECQAGNICLNTSKRSRTRKPKAKPGRPAGSRNRRTQEPSKEEAPAVAAT